MLFDRFQREAAQSEPEKGMQKRVTKLFAN